MIIPGPKEPKDLNSFLFPAINELPKLEKGVKYFSIQYKKNIYIAC